MSDRIDLRYTSVALASLEGLANFEVRFRAESGQVKSGSNRSGLCCLISCSSNSNSCRLKTRIKFK
jgi:hypothetical protein